MKINYRILIGVFFLVSIVTGLSRVYNKLEARKIAENIILDQVEKEAIKKEEANKSLLEIEKARVHQEIIQFASDNKDDITIVSEVLLQKKDEISKEETFNYEKYILNESKSVKQSFKTVLAKLSFDPACIKQNGEDKRSMNMVLYWFGQFDDGTIIEMIYDPKGDMDTTSVPTREITKITENIYIIKSTEMYV